MTQLSPHFTLEEFLESQIASRMGSAIEAPVAVRANLEQLCYKILEPARTLFSDRPIVISSGYRPDWLNSAIGGAKDSAHLEGRAADFHVLGISDLAVAKILAGSEIPFDQLIYEFSWIHVSFAASPRRAVMTAYAFHGKTRYREGLEANA